MRTASLENSFPSLLRKGLDLNDQSHRDDQRGDDEGIGKIFPDELSPDG